MLNIHKSFPSDQNLTNLFTPIKLTKKSKNNEPTVPLHNNQTQFNLSTQTKIAIGVGIVTSTLSITYMLYSLR